MYGGIFTLWFTWTAVKPKLGHQLRTTAFDEHDVYVRTKEYDFMISHMRSTRLLQCIAG